MLGPASSSDAPTGPTLRALRAARRFRRVPAASGLLAAFMSIRSRWRSRGPGRGERASHLSPPRGPPLRRAGSRAGAGLIPLSPTTHAAPGSSAALLPRGHQERRQDYEHQRGGTGRTGIRLLQGRCFTWTTHRPGVVGMVLAAGRREIPEPSGFVRGGSRTSSALGYADRRKAGRCGWRRAATMPSGCRLTASSINSGRLSQSGLPRQSQCILPPASRKRSRSLSVRSA